MIYSDSKSVTSVTHGTKKVLRVYHYGDLIWHNILSCFGSGIWKGYKPWIGTEKWKGHK